MHLNMCAAEERRNYYVRIGRQSVLQLMFHIGLFSLFTFFFALCRLQGCELCQHLYQQLALDSYRML